MKHQHYQVIIRTNCRDLPKPHELRAAQILTEHFRSDVIFLRTEAYRTPDLRIGNMLLEL